MDSRLIFVQTGRTERLRAFRAASRAGLGWYYVRELPEGKWSAEHTMRGSVGMHESKDAAMKACNADDISSGA